MPQTAILGFSKRGFMAHTLAEATKSSAPVPGIHPAITSRDSSLISMDTSSNPAERSNDSKSLSRGAPDTQQAYASFVLSRSGISAVATTSDIATLPPGFRIRNASLMT